MTMAGRLTRSGIPLIIDKVTNRNRRPALSVIGSDVKEQFSGSLPPRSMVGQLTLDQHIGVRIPGGQPIEHFLAPS
jgi:hypothetical protein